MNNEENIQKVPQELQQTSDEKTQETPSESCQETLSKESEKTPEQIEVETLKCNETNPDKWNSEMQLQRNLSVKPDLEILQNRTVLFVDDEEAMLRSIERCLREEPYNKLFAVTVQEALEILKKEEVHVIVTDMFMPNMNGIEFFKIVKKMYPRIIKMILSGYEDKDNILHAINEGDIVKFIPKLWNNKEDFKKIILEAIELYNIRNECTTAGK